MSTKNLALVFTKIPAGLPVVGEHITVKDIGPIDLDQDLPSGSLLLEILYCSFDPYLRGLLRDPKIESYFPALPIGQPLQTASLARVLKSKREGYSEGDTVIQLFPVQQYLVLPEDKGAPRKLDVENGPKDVRDYLGSLGMPGLTAYSSLYEIGKPKKGETIFISSAAGAVGQLVGQLAKHEGLTVFGSVGTDEKLKYIIDTLGFDGGFNYKKEKTDDALKRLLPGGKLDIYYDNVGGEQLATSLEYMRNYGRIVACGMISQYNLAPNDRYPILNLMNIVTKRLTMQGFIVSDPEMRDKWQEEHQKNVGKWLKDGSFTAQSHETAGIENSGEAFVGMLRGENFGKAVLKIKA